MKLAFLTDPLSHFKIYKDSTYVMMREAARRGHQIFTFEQKDLRYVDHHVQVNSSLITITNDPENWFTITRVNQFNLIEFDAVFIRKDPPFDAEYLYATYLFELAERQGVRIYNRPSAIRNHNEKLAILEFSGWTAPTLVSNNIEHLRLFHQQHQDVILKPLDAMGGSGIFRVQGNGLNLGAILETMTNNGARTIMAQRYLPEIAEGDKRILLIAGTVVPYSLARYAQDGEVRANLAAGGKGIALPLTALELQIAKQLAPLLWQRGLFLVGLDMIGGHLTEINVTSPTCFQEIMQQTDCDVASLFINAVESEKNN